MNNQGELKIAIAFSGGGYRAAAFNLGALSYLNLIKLNEKTLLEHVIVLSTVSGGTITGARYAIGIKKGEKFETIYKALYDFMKLTDLVGLGLSRLISNEGWYKGKVKSLITAFADIYDEKLFKNEKFGTLLTDALPIHLKHISFNSTEFSNALQFRFQRSEKIKNPESGEPERGIIGNNYFRINENIAGEIRMADILAASSCFPGGFEPINFPSDFVYEGANELLKLNSQPQFPVGLMDGGIVDNQGIEPILLAEARMKKNREDNLKTTNEIDLIIVSDVASPFMEDYKASIQKKKNWWRKLTPALIFSINTLILILSLFILVNSIKGENIIWIIVSTFFLTVTIFIYLVGKALREIPKKFQVPELFMKPLGKLLRLKLRVYENLINNRINSVLKMTNEVFLKHVRRLNYRSIYNDNLWKNRRIMNAIYELRNDEGQISKKIENGILPDYLYPSEKIIEVAKVASAMGTTLWFTKDELEKKNMLNALIACGQFTCCWNLLEYIEKIKKDSANTNENHKELIGTENELKSNWVKFQENPYWMVDSYNSI